MNKPLTTLILLCNVTSFCWYLKIFIGREVKNVYNDTCSEIQDKDYYLLKHTKKGVWEQLK